MWKKCIIDLINFRISNPNTEEDIVPTAGNCVEVLNWHCFYLFLHKIFSAVPKLWLRYWVWILDDRK